MSYRNQGGDRPGRVIVGIDPTLSGLQALRVAVAEARRRGAALHAVRAWGAGPGEPTAEPPPSPGPTPTVGPAPGLTGGLGPSPSPHPRDDWSERQARGSLAADAAAVVSESFAETMGGEPDDLTVRMVVLPDTPGPVLAEYACRDEDVLVLGRGRHGRVRRPRGSPVVRYCLRRATCPVLVVPPPPLTRAGSTRSLLRQLRREIDELADGGADR